MGKEEVHYTRTFQEFYVDVSHGVGESIAAGTYSHHELLEISDRDLEDLLNMTDSDEDTSSTSSDPCMFESNQPFVLELHELKKDETSTNTAAPTEEDKKKKLEKRRRKRSQQDANKDKVSDTSSSLSESVPTIPVEPTREEFYDAHESYHALPEPQQASPTAALVLAQVHSEHVHEAKVPSRTATSATVSATNREPSAINKPVSNPP